MPGHQRRLFDELCGVRFACWMGVARQPTVVAVSTVFVFSGSRFIADKVDKILSVLPEPLSCARREAAELTARSASVMFET